MFTLTDPRKQALSQAGANFGGGLSDALVNYIENRRFGKAMQGVNENTPQQEILQRLSQNQVAPRFYEQLYNPQVQAAFNRERRSQALQSIGKMDFSGMTPTQISSSILDALSHVEGGVEHAGGIIEQAIKQSQAGKPLPKIKGEEGGMPTARKGGGNQPVPQRTQNYSSPSGEQERVVDQGRAKPGQARPLMEQPLATPAMGAAGATGLMQGPGQQMQGPRQQMPGQVMPQMGQSDIRSDIRMNAPVTAPINEGEYANLVQRYRETVNPDPVAAEAWADKLKTLNDEQRTAEIADLQRQEDTRQAVLGEDERIRGTADRFIMRDYGVPGEQFDPQLFDLLVQKMGTETGTNEARYNKAMVTVNDIQDSLRELSETETPPVLGAFRSSDYNAYLNRIATTARNIVEHPGLVSGVKPQIIGKVKSVLMAKGLGDIDAEVVANRPSQEVMDIVDKTPRFPRFMSGEKGQGQKAEAIVNRLANDIGKAIEVNPWTSPILLRHAYLDKGYSEEQISRAFDTARNNKVMFSPYQRSQFALLAKPEKPSLSTIFGGESRRGFWDYFISGRK